MLFLLLLCYLSLSARGQEADDDWLDPYDMLNYDSSTKTMKKPPEPTTFTNVVTKRREYVQDQTQAELTTCNQQKEDLQRQIEDQTKEMARMSQQPTCSPVFKRFLSRLLKEIQRLGVPTDSSDVFYDAKIKLSKQAMTEIESLLDGEDRWRTGALDNAVSQILVDFKQHDYEGWKWRFEDSFGVELDTVLKIMILVLIISTIICTQLWSAVSWLVQFRRMFAVSFFVSIIWNWFYLYQTAFAKHQNDIVQMENFNEKCTGVKKINWRDNLKEWFRTTWTLQDDPCKKYYEVLMVNPLLLVPPTKAISVTITTFITEPLKHFGQGISEFLRELLKDLPVTLQIPVLITIVLSILVVMYGSVHAAFQHGIMAPFRRPRRDPPPAELEHNQRPPPRIENRDYLAGGDAPAHAPPLAIAQQHIPRQQGDNARLDRNHIHCRRPNRVKEEKAPIGVETLKAADPRFSEDELDGEQHEERLEVENASANSGSEDQQEAPEEVRKENAAAQKDQPKNQQTESNSSQAKKKQIQTKQTGSKDEPRKDVAVKSPQPADIQPSQTDVQDPGASGEEQTHSISQTGIETVGVPVQETNPAAAE
ncbi:chloride channel CLIC-like protein 1 isoform X1 [Poecilia latipinna]|uniref:chloride channel CLIC-like protein 1 isoform X1 n=2 Tax=Poecilia latipinna TaxID=48699 RepID=UPI00072DAE39|nr:PREDICTED: chloride channel CLIC-like protein 1 isoform X1 [Poecilia latipinna]